MKKGTAGYLFKRARTTNGFARREEKPIMKRKPCTRIFVIGYL